MYHRTSGGQILATCEITGYVFVTLSILDPGQLTLIPQEVLARTVVLVLWLKLEYEIQLNILQSLKEE